MGTDSLIDAADILGEAQNCVECLFMAASDLSRTEAEPLRVVANIASDKIEKALALLGEYCKDIREGQVPAAPEAKPVIGAVRTKGRGKP